MTTRLLRADSLLTSRSDCTLTQSEEMYNNVLIHNYDNKLNNIVVHVFEVLNFPSSTLFSK